MIKQVHIRNFKSLEEVSVDLEPITILIGRSGSGKSNFVEALRWLRDTLTMRDGGRLQQHGEWSKILCATAPRPLALSFALTFTAPGLAEDFCYELRFQQPSNQDPDAAPQFAEEKLCLGTRSLFHQTKGQWVEKPPLVNPPKPAGIMLGALTGIQEATVAHLVLTNGIGCYAFPDRVLTARGQPGQTEAGLSDNGDTFLQTFTDITTDLATWQRLREIAASLRRLKPSLRSIDLQQPHRQQIVVSLEMNGRILAFDLNQESEGFRRLFACLLALYQTPSKQTLIFDEPEKGISPAGLTILAEEFKAHAARGQGQVLLTTHSPEFLDQFAPEQLRVVEMRGYSTKIGPIASEQIEALREHFLKPGELLTVDQARLEGSLAGA